MSKINLTRKQIDRIFDEAIKAIGTGEETFSCLALLFRNRTVADLYEKIYGFGLHPAPGKNSTSDRLLYNVMRFASNRQSWKNWDRDSTLTPDEAIIAKNLRIVMLSLARVAWRDWV